MRLTSFFLAVVGILLCMEGKAQVSFKTEYIGNSDYWFMNNNEPDKRVGNREGSAIVYQGIANIPVYRKKNENERLTSWGINLSGEYASLNNKNFTDEMVSEIMNLQFGISHQRPLGDKWSMMANVGVGVYTPSKEFSKIRYRNMRGNASLIFIRHINPNLEIGGGVAANCSFGYPMIFPAFYLNYEDDFTVKVSVLDGIKASGGYNFNNYFSLNLVAEFRGQLALLEVNGKDKMFTHQYAAGGISPEIKFGNTGISMPIVIGVNAFRPAYYSDKALMGVFAEGNDFYFSVSPYASVGLRYGF